MTALFKWLGVVLILGGLAHSVGVAHLYFTEGVPDANRVLLDIWIAEAQLIAGGLYLAAASSNSANQPRLAAFGSLTIVGFTVPMLPVLVVRAPFIFRVPSVIYLFASIYIVMSLWFDHRRRGQGVVRR